MSTKFTDIPCSLNLNYLFHNDNQTSYTTYINHARWHRCLCLDGLRVGGHCRVLMRSFIT